MAVSRSGISVRALLPLLMAALFYGPLAQADLPDFKPIIQRNQASVVNISTTQDLKNIAAQGRGSPPSAPPGMPPGMEEFFRHFRGMPMPEQREARSLGIATVSLIDTDCDPDLIDLPIPGNDDGIRSIELVTRHLADAILAAKNQVVGASKQPIADTAQAAAIAEKADA